MRIKGNVTFKSDDFEGAINDFEIEISALEIKELIKETPRVTEFVDLEHLHKSGTKLVVDSKGEVLYLNDLIKILPSENCVTNADTIKYDESIDGKDCIIWGIDRLLNQLLVKENRSDVFKQFKILSSWTVKSPFSKP